MPFYSLTSHMKICLAPMDGVTDCAYRILCKKIFEQHGAPDDELMLWTEFMSADGYVHNPPGVIKHIQRSDYDHETIAQIFWWNTDTLISCILDIEKKYDFAGIELNMGCPSPKIMKCAAGSGMLKDKQKTLDILKEIAGKISTPFSLKTRIGLSQDDIQEQFDFLIQASKYVTTIWVHGRTYKQSHAGEVRRDFIYDLKKELPETIIIGNGGLRTYQDGLDKSGNLDGIMPAQWAIGNPRILTPHTPSPAEVYETIIYHLSLMTACELQFKQAVASYDHSIWLKQPTLAQLEDTTQQIRSWALDVSQAHSPIEFRKYLFRYLLGLPNSKDLKKKIPQARDYASLVGILEEFFEGMGTQI